ncbi:hypothetical protein H5410_017154 [Solanum commersonii]|uniref:Uncharacterized protein n=1 Tax=Solanum commersonii TaxID=4109 RepID=A0A9J5ZZ89_SOLCO|nr:hypothetical protein H5410_017154 [Solanum commersonii]
MLSGSKSLCLLDHLNTIDRTNPIYIFKSSVNIYDHDELVSSDQASFPPIWKPKFAFPNCLSVGVCCRRLRDLIGMQNPTGIC